MCDSSLEIERESSDSDVSKHHIHGLRSGKAIFLRSSLPIMDEILKKFIKVASYNRISRPGDMIS